MRCRLLASLLVAFASTACASSPPEHEVPASSATHEATSEPTAEPTATASAQGAGPIAAPHVEMTVRDDPAAQAVFEKENAKLMACYEAELRRDPAITIQWIGTFATEPSGAVSEVDLVGVHEQLAECITGVIKETKHDARAGQKTFIVTMWTGDNKPTL
jgi:hypothetical protein